MDSQTFYVKAGQIIFDFEIDDDLTKRLDVVFGLGKFVPDGSMEDMQLIARTVREWKRAKLKS